MIGHSDVGRVLEIGRDLAERNEFVAFAIRRVVNPGLQAALDRNSSACASERWFASCARVGALTKWVTCSIEADAVQ